MGAIRVFNDLIEMRPEWELELACEDGRGRSISLYVDGPAPEPDRDYNSGTLTFNSAEFDFSSGKGVLISCDIEVQYEYYHGEIPHKDLIGRYDSLDSFVSDIVSIARDIIGFDIDEADAYKKLINAIDRDCEFWN